MSSGATRRFWRSLGFQLNVWYVAVFLGSLAVLAAVVDYRVTRSIEAKDREIITARLRELRARYDEGGIDGVAAAFAEPEPARREPLYVRVSDAANQMLFLHVPDRDLAFDPESVQVQVGEDRRRWLRVRAQNDGRVWIIGAAPLSADLWLQVGRSDERSREMLGHLRTGALTVVGVALLFGLIGGASLTSQVLRPIRQLAEAVRAVIRSGDMTARVPPRGSGDEVDELIRLFNRMLDKNQALLSGMREALDNVAHDLRTPLTRLRGAAEVALRSADRPELLRDALADSVEESDRVLLMLKTLMDISEAETGVMRLERQPVDLDEVAREVIDLYAHVAQERRIALRAELAGGLVVSADRSRLRQVVGNLLDNALKYTPEGGAVAVRSAAAGPWAELAVADTGVGISVEDQSKIWQRLYRADKSRSARGLGLGLSLVRAVVAAHGGTVAVESQLDRGSVFTVRLPLGDRQPATKEAPDGRSAR